MSFLSCTYNTQLLLSLNWPHVLGGEEKKTVVGWVILPSPKEIYILIPGICDCCLIWQKGPRTCDQVKDLEMLKFA